MQVITDPVVDLTVFVISQLAVKPLMMALDRVSNVSNDGEGSYKAYGAMSLAVRPFSCPHTSYRIANDMLLARHQNPPGHLELYNLECEILTAQQYDCTCIIAASLSR
jgi:hypothetical protein